MRRRGLGLSLNEAAPGCSFVVRTDAPAGDRAFFHGFEAGRIAGLPEGDKRFELAKRLTKTVVGGAAGTVPPSKS